MRLVIRSINRGYAFRITYNVDSIDHIVSGPAEVVCGSRSRAKDEGENPDADLMRIYFKDGENATFDVDTIAMFFEGK